MQTFIFQNMDLLLSFFSSCVFYSTTQNKIDSILQSFLFFYNASRYIGFPFN